MRVISMKIYMHYNDVGNLCPVEMHHDNLYMKIHLEIHWTFMEWCIGERKRGRRIKDGRIKSNNQKARNDWLRKRNNGTLKQCQQKEVRAAAEGEKLRLRWIMSFWKLITREAIIWYDLVFQNSELHVIVKIPNQNYQDFF